MEAENKVSRFRDFPTTVDFDGLSLVFILAGGAVYECCVLQPEWHLIMESVVLRSRGSVTMKLCGSVTILANQNQNK